MMSNAPSRKDRTRPVELLGLSAALGAFVGVIAMISTRDAVLAFIAFAITFILSIVTLATLSLAVRASPDEKIDLDEQDEQQGH